MSKASKKVLAYLQDLLLRYKRFTGKLELNFKDGELKDIQETRRTKYNERNCIDTRQGGIGGRS